MYLLSDIYSIAFGGQQITTIILQDLQGREALCGQQRKMVFRVRSSYSRTYASRLGESWLHARKYARQWWKYLGIWWLQCKYRYNFHNL